MTWLKLIWKWIKMISGTSFLIVSFFGLGIVVYLSIFSNKQPTNTAELEVNTPPSHCTEWNTELAYERQISDDVIAKKLGTYCVDFGDNTVTKSLREARWATYSIELVGTNGKIASYGNQEPYLWDSDNVDLIDIPDDNPNTLALVEISSSASNVFVKVKALKLEQNQVVETDSLADPITKYQASNRRESEYEIDGFYIGRNGEVFIDVLVPDAGNVDRCMACAEYHVITKQFISGKFYDVNTRPYVIENHGNYNEVSIYTSEFNITTHNNSYESTDMSIKWWPELEKSTPYENANTIGKVGTADITLTNSENGKSSTIESQRFHVPDDYINYLDITNISLDLSQIPAPSFINMDSEERYASNWDTPFLFEDIDFDGKDEFIIINHGQGQRMGHAFEVYDVEVIEGQPFMKLKDYPPFSELDLHSEFDIENKNITSYRSGGACLSEWETYTINGESIVPLELIQYDYDAKGCYKHTYGYTHKDGKHIPILLKKETVN